MTSNQEFAALSGRIAKAKAERDAWRSSGMQEKYLEAHSTVEALELQLDRLRQQGLRTFSEPAAAAEELGNPEESERELMAALAITYQDGVYRLGEYRYHRLADAVNYARLRRLQTRRA